MENIVFALYSASHFYDHRLYRFPTDAIVSPGLPWRDEARKRSGPTMQNRRWFSKRFRMVQSFRPDLPQAGRYAYTAARSFMCNSRLVTAHPTRRRRDGRAEAPRR
jgi:hypothetical protein